ncbi:MAG TPA: DoxX family protein [Longimicrobiales bacterium]|nr:DoxX family protein [Longimicrobiales bacterium]
MELGTSADDRRTDAALLLLRVVIGGIFVAHGAQKLFEFGLGGTAAFFTKVGAPMPEVTSVLVTALESLGGLALILGALTRLVAPLLAIDMVGAILLVHMKYGFFGGMGVEFPLVLLASLLALTLAGAGAYSLDARVGRDHVTV